MPQTTLDWSAARKPLSQIAGNAQKRPRSNDDQDPTEPPSKSHTAPAGLISVTAQSRRMVLEHLQGWIRALGTQHRYIGGLGGDGTQLRMPLRSSDGRVLTWHKFAEEIASKVAIQNHPSDEDDCWFVPASGGDTAGYPVKKLWNGGERNKWRVHRILFFLKNPTIDEKSTNDIAHRCRRGRFDEAAGINWSCINPYHTVSVPHAVNLDHNKCHHGCLQLCPHSPKCVWTNDEGKKMKCRDLVPMPAVCTCGAGCF